MIKELAILLRAKGAAQTAADVKKVDSSISRLTSRAGTFATKLKTNVGGALTTFGGRLKGAALGIAAFAGVSGLLGLGAMFTASIGKAQQFGAASLRLSLITGLAIETTSKMVDALDFFGISAETQTGIAGRFEKNIAAIAKTSKAAAKFEKDYGISIRDSKGHLLDYNAQLKASADFFTNRNIPASKKAAALQKLYGKTWQELIPILATGRAGIEKAEREAMTLSQQDLDNITKNKQATRKWNDAIGDLQTQIGIGLLPVLTDLANAASDFVQTHGPEIRTFFHNLAATGRAAAGTIVGIVGAIQSAWSKIPGPVRELLVKGLIADRTVKFLFGFSITGTLGKMAGGVAEGLGGALVRAGIGKAFVQPVFVTNPGFGGGGGGGVPGTAGKGAGLGLPSLATLGSFGAALAIGFIPVAAAGLTLALVDNEPARQRALQGRRDTATARGGDGSRVGPMTGPPGTQPVNRRPATGGLSPEDRQILSNQWKTSLTISDRTERVRAAVSAGAVRTSSAQATAAAKLQAVNARTADRTEALRVTLASKHFSPKITVPVHTTVIANIAARDSSRTVTTYRLGTSGSLGKFNS